MSYLSDQLKAEVHSLIINDCKLGGSLDSLAGSLVVAVRNKLPTTASNSTERLWQWLDFLNEYPPIDGRLPLFNFLNRAAAVAEPLPGAGRLRDIANSLNEQTTSTSILPESRPETIPSGGISGTSTGGTTTPTPSDKYFVLLVSGIRDYGGWQAEAKRVIEQKSQMEAIRVSHGYYDAVSFVSPFASTEKPYQVLAEAYATLRDRYGNVRISIVAHSFGTFLVGKLLTENPSVKLHRLVLCGSVLRRDFDWAAVRSKLGVGAPDHEPAILNECGTADLWPIVAGAASENYGAAGRHGFETDIDAKSRWFRGGHNLFFKRSHMERSWLPFLLDGTLPQGDANQPSPSMYERFAATFAVGWIWALLVFLMLTIRHFWWAFLPVLASLLLFVDWPGLFGQIPLASGIDPAPVPGLKIDVTANSLFTDPNGVGKEIGGEFRFDHTHQYHIAFRVPRKHTFAVKAYRLGKESTNVELLAVVNGLSVRVETLTAGVGGSLNKPWVFPEDSQVVLFAGGRTGTFKYEFDGELRPTRDEPEDPQQDPVRFFNTLSSAAKSMEDAGWQSFRKGLSDNVSKSWGQMIVVDAFFDSQDRSWTLHCVPPRCEFTARQNGELVVAVAADVVLESFKDIHENDLKPDGKRFQTIRLSGVVGTVHWNQYKSHGQVTFRATKVVRSEEKQCPLRLDFHSLTDSTHGVFGSSAFTRLSKAGWRFCSAPKTSFSIFSMESRRISMSSRSVTLRNLVCCSVTT